jgi:hypothetical protein
MTLSKKILLSSFAAAMAFSGVSFAATPGFYVQGTVGQSDTNPPSAPAGYSIDGKGFAGRLAAGYQFDQYWGAELGWTAFAKTSFRLPDDLGTVNGKYTQNAFDLMGKASYSFDNGFGVFGKAGIGYIRRSSSSSISGIGSESETSNVTRPTAAVGVRYDFNQNVGVDMSFQRYFKGGDLTQNSDFYGVGLIYSFG